MDEVVPVTAEDRSLTFISENGHFFEVELDFFEGPIDLLLHLVKKNELPLEKISLYQITSQYLTCVEQMRHLDLEVAGEYLVIAATLLSIKSSILLNEPVQLISDDDGNLIDPHQALLDRIREAAIYKDGASLLGQKHMLGIDVFENLTTLRGVEGPPIEYQKHDPFLLARAFRKILGKMPADIPPIEITVDSVTIVQRMVWIVDSLSKSGGKLVFEQLIPDLTDRASVVSSFLALLELCKRGAISVFQGDIFEEIIIASASTDPLSFTSEFDTDEDLSESRTVMNE